MAAPIIDIFLVYQFLKRLVTPFNKTKAYELGLIDANGKLLRKAKTTEEQRAMGYFDRLVFNLKRLLALVPGGKTVLASYVAALLLLKEKNERLVDDENYLAEQFKNQMNVVDINEFKKFEKLYSELSEDNSKYPVTYLKLHVDPMNPRKLKFAEILHTHIPNYSNPNLTPERTRYLVHNSTKHKKLVKRGYEIYKYGSHDKPSSYYTVPVKIRKEDVYEDGTAGIANVTGAGVVGTGDNPVHWARRRRQIRVGEAGDNRQYGHPINGVIFLRRKNIQAQYKQFSPIAQKKVYYKSIGKYVLPYKSSSSKGDNGSNGNGNGE